jgi:catechol 2,3-dioxygenase-like lactoylglutathione lyase family enzyme
MSPCLRIACSSFARSLRFYTDVLGFGTTKYAPDLRCAELERDGIGIELTEYNGEGLAPLEYPFGRGMTVIVWTDDAESVYAAIEAYGARLHKPMTAVWSEGDGARSGHEVFEVVDPDGYILRFCQAR